MKELTSSERKKFRGLAHGLKPIVQIGQNGLTEKVIEAIKIALKDHELIKIKFIDYKDEKKEISAEIAEKTKSTLAGLIGNIAIFYKMSANPEKRRDFNSES